MKTTIDLPDALVKQVKLRALHGGRKLKDEVAELLRKGLAAEADTEPEMSEPAIRADKKTGLPVIECRHPAKAAAELTPDRVAELLLTQEVGWHHAAGR